MHATTVSWMHAYYRQLFRSTVWGRVGIRFSVWLVSGCARICATLGCHCDTAVGVGLNPAVETARKTTGN